MHDARAAFLACMRATCSPGTPTELPPAPHVCERPELDGAAAVLLALLDRGLTLAVSGGDAAQRVGALVAEETGAGHAEVADADWILVHGPPADAIARARRGSRIAPERGATLVIAATDEALPMSIAGPGIPGRATAFVALDAVSAHAFTAANATPPCGVDLFVVSPGCLIGLPRSVSVHHHGAA